ncbi:hypothetical protein Barb4_00876 [Bacteroidales bacterium Barb4]|nr:hypothetical protein Barb4_00876 [Bacteroidales bacterium Barb4]
MRIIAKFLLNYGGHWKSNKQINNYLRRKAIQKKRRPMQA